MAGDEVRLERHGDGTATVRIDRPQARNALNIATRKALAQACREVAEDASIRAVVLTGGPDVFAAGADLKEFVDAGAVEMLKRRSERWWQAVADVPQPMIASVNGFALGGGLELAMCCDIIVAGREARPDGSARRHHAGRRRHPAPDARHRQVPGHAAGADRRGVRRKRCPWGW